MRRQDGIFVFSLLIFLLISSSIAVAEEVIITYKDGVDSKNGISSSVGLEENLNVTHEFSILDGFVADVSLDEKKLLEKNPEIIISENTQHYLYIDDAADQINASSVWNVQLNNTNITGAQQTVCIIDTGVDYTHPAFGNCWGNNNESSNCVILGGYDFVNDDNDPMDDHGHGTHVAGIVASQDLTYTGTAYGSNIVSMKVFDASGAGGALIDIIDAMEWCINNASKFNITSISMSLGDRSFHETSCAGTDYESVVQNATLNNISVVAAAGNCDDIPGRNPQTCDGLLGVSSPACVPGVIPVGAVDDSDIQYYQRWNGWEVLAPGISIYSTWPNTQSNILSGTSMATPFVSGAIALLQQYSHLKNNRSLNSAEIITALNTTSKWINDTATGILYPRLDAYAALTTLPFLNFTSINYSDGNSVNVSFLFLPINLTFSEDVDFTYSINDSSRKTACIACNYFNGSLLLPSYGNLTFDFYITDEFGNVESESLNLFMNFSGSNYSTDSYIGESTVNFVIENLDGSFGNLSSLDVYINSSNNLSINYTGNETVLLNNTYNQTILEFNYSFNGSTLDLSEMILVSGKLTEDKTYLIVRGLNLSSQTHKKTIYMDKNSTSNNTCIKDSEVFSSTEFTNDCSDTDEYLVNCPGINGNYSCSLVDNNSRYLFSGLIHSAVFERGGFCGDGFIDDGETCSTCPADFGACPVAPSGSTGGGGGGGGGVSPPRINIITPSVYEMREGYVTTVEETDVILFRTNNGEDHNITIDEITQISIRLTINSNPIILLLVAGEERKLNLTSIDFYNFYLKVNLVSGERANIFIQNILEEIRTEEPFAEEEDVEDVPIYMDIGAYLYFLIAVIIFVLIFFINRKINKMEKENKIKELDIIKENEEKIKPKTKRKR